MKIHGPDTIRCDRVTRDWPPAEDNHRWRELQTRLVRRVMEVCMNSFSKMENRVITPG